MSVRWMMKKAKITIIGLLGNSVFVRVPHFHSVGETLSADSLYMEPGGKGSNQAVAAARLGAEVVFISSMGRDSIARECLEFMENEGIRCLTQFNDTLSSPYACILTDSKGENQVTVHRGSADNLSAEFIKECEADIADSDILLLNNESPLEANIAALDIAGRHGVKAVLNPAPYAPLPSDYLRRFYLITPNRHEAQMLVGASEGADCREIVKKLAEAGIQRCAITLGGSGSVLWNGTRLIEHDAIRVEVADTTGAGDCFNGAICCAVAEGMSEVDALDMAVRASALSVSKSFVMPALPYRNEINFT